MTTSHMVRRSAQADIVRGITMTVRFDDGSTREVDCMPGEIPADVLRRQGDERPHVVLWDKH